MDQEELKRAYERNIKLIYGLNSLWAFMVIMPIIVPFFQSRGLSMSEIFQLQALFGLALFIFEVPSGYFSDLVGRKTTLLFAGLFHGLGYTSFLVAHDFYSLAAAELVLALAASLFSGTDVSIIYDSQAALNSQKASIKLVGRKVFYLQMGETLGGLVGGFLLLISFEAPIWFQALVAWFPILLIVPLKEPPRIRMDRRRHRENVLYVYTSLFKHSRLLNLILLTGMSYGAATLIAVWGFQKYWQQLEIPLIYFGYLWAFSNLTVAVMARYAHKLEVKIGSSLTVIFMTLLPVVGYLGIGWSASVWGLCFCLCFQLSRGINAVVLKDALNRRVSSDLRATANSVSSLGVRGLFILIGPMVGAMMDHEGVSRAFTWLGFFYLVLFFMLVLPLLHQRKFFQGADELRTQRK